MKKKTLLLCLFITAITIIFIVLINIGQDTTSVVQEGILKDNIEKEDMIQDDMEYNNTIKMTDLITVTYSEFEIANLKENVELNGISFYAFKSNFNVQCLRKTFQGYYAVLLQDDGSKVFVFINDTLLLEKVVVVDNFMTKEDFSHQISDQRQTFLSEIVAFDKNTFLGFASAMDITSHIVEEGVVIIRYSRFVDGKLSSDSVVDSVEFIENEELPAKADILNGLNIPYILEIDKISF